MTTRQTTQTPPENSSEVDWDLLDELEGDPAQTDQDLALQMALNRPWTMQDLEQAGIPQTQGMLAVAVYYSSLQDMKADLNL